ncbi:HalX domain-containing protein [Halorussus salinisoli]|uniref:HalX domain-containing protein n=1 Tax=Halorussus salinisoli TaxID=2558242 RepID=UPI0010C1D917|nr:HalX domain-containing protein [Halorussus salinisoli]
MSESDTGRILVVDDNRDLADLYADWLAGTYTVKTAYSGEETLTKLDSSTDIVLLDRRMPDLSGDDVLGTIRDQGLDCRVALVTSIEPDYDILDLGFDDYLQKPVQSAELHDLVESLLTRTQYSEHIQEYFAVVSKKATIQSEKDDSELATHPEFTSVVEQSSKLKSEIDTLQEDFTEDDFVAAFHDLD